MDIIVFTLSKPHMSLRYRGAELSEIFFSSAGEVRRDGWIAHLLMSQQTSQREHAEINCGAP